MVIYLQAFLILPQILNKQPETHPTVLAPGRDLLLLTAWEIFG
jgi:hypothetical protein